MDWGFRIALVNRDGNGHGPVLGWATIDMPGSLPEGILFPPEAVYNRDIRAKSSLWNGVREAEPTRTIDIDAKRCYINVKAEQVDTQAQLADRVKAYQAKGWQVEATWKDCERSEKNA